MIHTSGGKTKGCGTLELKGDVLEGMAVFDSATPRTRRGRNQRKGPEVLEQMKKNSAEVEPAEISYHPNGEFRATRDIFGPPSSDPSSPVSIFEFIQSQILIIDRSWYQVQRSESPLDLLQNLDQFFNTRAPSFQFVLLNPSQQRSFLYQVRVVVALLGVRCPCIPTAPTTSTQTSLRDFTALVQLQTHSCKPATATATASSRFEILIQARDMTTSQLLFNLQFQSLLIPILSLAYRMVNMVSILVMALLSNDTKKFEVVIWLVALQILSPPPILVMNAKARAHFQKSLGKSLTSLTTLTNYTDTSQIRLPEPWTPIKFHPLERAKCSSWFSNSCSSDYDAHRFTQATSTISPISTTSYNFPSTPMAKAWCVPHFWNQPS